MATKAGLEIVIGLVDEASSGLAKMTGSIKGLGAMAAGAGAAGLLAIGAASLAAGLTFDEVSDGFVAKTGATGAALAGLEDDFAAVFGSIPTDAKAAGDAMATLAQRTGLVGEPLQDVTIKVLEMSRLLGGDATQNAEGFAKVMESWGLDGATASAALDKIFVAAQQSGIGIGTLMESVKTFGPTLKAMGFTLDESVALLAGFEKGGVNGEKAMVALRTAAGNFAKEGIPLKEGLAGAIEAIKNAATETDALALGMKTFGAKGGLDMVTAIREGKLSVDDIAAAMAGSAGAIKTAGAATEDYAEKMLKMKNKITLALAPIGLTIMDTISAAIEAAMPLIEKLLPYLPQIAVGIAAIAAAFLLIGAVTQIAAFVTALSTLGAAAAAAAAAVGLALGPILLIIAAIALAVVLFKAAWDTNFLGIRDTIEAVFAAIKTIVEPILAWLRGEMSFADMATGAGAGLANLGAVLATAWENIKTKALEIWEGVKVAVAQVLEALRGIIIEKIADFIAPLVGGMDNARTIVENAWNTISTFLGNVWEGIKTAAAAAWEALKGIVGAAIEAVRTVIATVLALISGDWSAAWETLKTGVAAIFGALGTTLATVAETIRAGLSTKWEEIKTAAGTAWEGIKATISTAAAGIKTNIETGLAGAGAWLDTTWLSIKTAAEVGWATITGAVTTGAGGMKPGLDTALLGAGTWLDTTWTSIQTAAGTAWTSIQTAAGTAWEGIKTTIVSIAEGIGTAIEKVFDALITLAGTLFQKILDALTGGNKGVDLGALLDLTKLRQTVTDIITELVTLKVAAIENMAEAVKAVQSLIDKLAELLTAFEKTLPNPFKDVAKWVTDARAEIDKLLKSIEDIVTAFEATLPNPFVDLPAWGYDARMAILGVGDELRSLWDDCNAALPNPFVDLWNWGYDAETAILNVGDTLSGLWEQCNDGLPNPFEGFGDWAYDAVNAIWAVIEALRELANAQSDAGAYATGTFYAQGGMAMVGEQGPEMMFVPRGSRIMSAGELASRGGVGATTTNTVNRAGDTIIVQDQAAMALLLREFRRGRVGRMAARF